MIKAIKLNYSTTEIDQLDVCCVTNERSFVDSGLDLSTSSTTTVADVTACGVAYKINCIPFYHTLVKQNRYEFYLSILVGYYHKVYNGFFFGKRRL